MNLVGRKPVFGGGGGGLHNKTQTGLLTHNDLQKPCNSIEKREMLHVYYLGSDQGAY